MTKFYLFLFYFLALMGISNALKAQINAGTDVTIPCGTSTTLTATVTASTSTTSYAIASIPFAPEVPGGTSVTLSDDSQSAALPIGFTFCFLGVNYTDFYIGSNGWVAFTTQTTSYTSATVPSTAASVPRNCIMGPWQDWNPGVAGGPYIKYQTLGVAPFRRLVVSYTNIPFFSCTTVTGNYQIVIYETTNFIQNHIISKPNCLTWAGGTATQGIHDAAGTIAYVVPGRNSTQWTATNESWQYTPNGTPAVTWFAGATNLGTVNPITVSPTTTTTYTAQITSCSGATFTDDVIVTVNPATSAFNAAALASFLPICVNHAAFALAGGSPAGGVYSGTGVSGGNFNPATAGAGTHTITYTVTSGSCTAVSTVNLTVNPLPTPTITAVPGFLCPNGGAVTLSGTPTGGVFSGTGVVGGTFDPSVAGVGNHTITYTASDANGCTNSTTRVLTVNPLPTASIGSAFSVCEGSSATMTVRFSGIAPFVLNYTINGVAQPVINTNLTTYTFPVTLPSGNHLFALTSLTDGRCTTTDLPSKFTLYVQPKPAPATTNATICLGVNGSLTATGLGGTMNWYAGATGGAILFTGSPYVVSPAVTTTYYVDESKKLPAFLKITEVVFNRTGVGASVYPAYMLGEDFVEITNLTDVSADMTGYKLEVYGVGARTFTFPALTLLSGQTAVVHLGTGVDDLANRFLNAGGANNSLVGTSLSGFVLRDVSNNVADAVALNAYAFPLSSGLGTYDWSGTLTGIALRSGVFRNLSDNNLNTDWSPAATQNLGIRNGTLATTVVMTACTSSRTPATVTVNPLPAGSLAVAAPKEICLGQSIGVVFTMTAGSAPWTISFTENGVAQTPIVTSVSPYTHTVTPTAAGTYTYQLTNLLDNNGCTQNFTQNDVLTVNPLPTTSLAIGSSAICSGFNTTLTFNLTGEAPWALTYSINGVAQPVVNVATSPHTITVSPAAGAYIYAVTALTDNNSCAANVLPANVNLTVNPLPTVVFTGNNTICLNQSTDLTFNLTGTAPWTVNYTLNGVAQTPLVINTATHTIPLTPIVGTYVYAITGVTDANTCAMLAPFPSVTVVVKPLPTLTLSPNATICAGASSNLVFTLTGTAPWTVNYTLNGVAQTQVIAASPFTLALSPAAGTYNYVITGVTDANTCAAIAPFANYTLTVNPLPTLVFTGDNTICLNQSTDLTFNLTGTAPWTVNYTLNGVAQTPLVINTATHTIPLTPIVGTYVYAITGVTDANTCAMLAPFPSVTVVVKPLPTLTLSPNATICAGASSDLVFTLTGTAPWTVNYTLNGVAQTQVIAASPFTLALSPAAGTYNYVITGVTDANTCAAIAPFASYTLTVNPLPTVVFTGNNTICLNQSTDLTFNLTGTAPWTVNYTLNGVAQTPLVINTATHTLAVSPAVGNNTYLITSVTDANTCVMLAPFPSVTVVVKPLPTLTLSPSTAICAGASSDLVFTLTGTAPWTVNYTLNGVAQTQVVAASPFTMPLSPAVGTYNYVITGVTDANTCAAIAPFASYTLTVNPLPTYTLSGNNTICIGESTNVTFTLTGAAPWTVNYTKNGVAQTPLVIAASPFNMSVSPAVGTTTYQITQVTDNIGCLTTGLSAVVSVVVNPLPTASVSVASPICIGQSTNLTFTFTGTSSWTVNYTQNGVAQTALTFTGVGPHTHNLTPSAAGSYDFQVTSVTDNTTCTNTTLSGISTLVVNPLPTATLTGNATLCIGQNTNLTYTLTGTAPWTVNYTKDGVAQTPLVIAASPFTLNVSPAVGTTNYQITSVTDANTCLNNTLSAVVAVVVNPLPTSTLTGTSTICIGENTDLTFVLTGTAPWTVNYSLNGVAQTALNIAASPFTLNVSPALGANAYLITSVVDANTCAMVAPFPTATVTVNPLPTASVSVASPICIGQSTALTFTFTGTTDWTVNYTQNGVAQTPLTFSGVGPHTHNITPSAAGTYDFQVTSVTDNTTCTNATLSGISTLVVNPLPTGTLTGNATLCAGDNTNLTFNLTGTAPWSVVYSINGVNQAAVAVAASPFVLNVSPAVGTTNYQITQITDANTCVNTTLSAVVAVVVNPLPTANISSSDASLCQGESSNLIFTMTGTAPWTIQYTLNGVAQAAITATSSPFSFTVTPANGINDYEITAYSDANSCNGLLMPDPTSITVHPTPVVTLSGSTQICLGSSADLSLTLSGTSPWTVSYSVDGVLQPSFLVNINPYVLTVSPGLGVHTYQITSIEDANGCLSASPSSAQTVTVVPLPTVAMTGDNAICLNESSSFTLTLTGTAPWTMAYTLNGTPQTLNVPTSPFTWTLTPTLGLNTYVVTGLSDANSCAASLPITASGTILVRPRPTLAIAGTSIICAGGNTDLTFTMTGTPPWTIQYDLNGVAQTPLTTSVNPFVYNVNHGVAGTYLYTLTQITDAFCTENVGLTTSATVTTNALPTGIISGGSEICALLSSNVIFTLTGRAPFTINYTDNGVAQSPITSTTTTYTLSVSPSVGTHVYSISQVTDANGCVQNSFTSTASVFVRPLPTATLPVVAAPMTFCASGNSDVTIGSAAAPSQVGVRYRLYRTDTNTLLDEGFGTGGALVLNTGTLSTSLTTGYTEIPLEVKATDLNYPTACEKLLLQTRTIRIYPLPKATLSGTATICAGSETPISFALTGNAPWDLTYTHTVAGVTTTVTETGILTSPFVTNETSGSFALVSLSDANCSANAAGLVGTALITVVPLPTVGLTSSDFDRAICQNQTISFTASGADLYTYYLNGVPVGTGASYTFPAGSLTISADGNLNQVWVIGQISTANCRSSSDTIKVKVHPLPTVNLGFSPRFLCTSNDTVTFNANLGGAVGAYTYNWRKVSGTTSVTAPGPVGQPTYNATSPGRYFVIITDNRFPTLCQITSDTISVQAFTAPVLNLGVDTTVCSANLPHTFVAQDLSHGPNVVYKWYKINNATGLPVLYTPATSGTFAADSAGFYIAQVTDIITGCSRRDTVRLQINQNPIFSITGHSGPTCLPSDTLIVVRTDVSPARIQWFGPGITGVSTDSLQAYVNQDGVYTAVVTNIATGCATSHSVNVEVGASIVANLRIAGDMVVVCEDEKVRLDAFHQSHDNTYTYEWRQLRNNIVVGTQSYLDLTYGTTLPSSTYERLRYSVKVSRPGGCTASDTVEVEFKRKPKAEIEGTYPSKICLGESLKFQGKGGLTYDWCVNDVCQSGTSSFEFKPTKAGIYRIMLKAKFTNACAVGTAELTVRVYDLPVLNQSSTTTVLCQTGIATFNAFDLSHDSDFTYVWKNLSSGAVIGNTAQIAIGFGGTYDVTSFEIKITDPESGCAKADTVKVKFVQDVAPAILAHAKEICLGDRVQLIGTGGKNFLWSTGEVTDRIWVKPTTVGYHKYSLVVDNGNECSERETFTYVKVNPLPIVKAHTSKTVNICAGRSIRLYPSGAKTYTWAHDPTVEGSIIVSPSVTTLYTVTGYDGNGCSSIDDVLIVVSPIADLGADKQLCQGESTEIGIPVLQGATYLWLPTGERTNKITVRRSGKYELRVKIDSCEFNDFITIDFKASPQPKVVKDTIICFDNDEAHAIQASIRNLDATITYLYQWYDTAGTLVGFTDKLDLDSAGTYRLKVTALYPHPCTGEVTTKVSDMCAPEIYIPEAFSPNGDGLNDEFTIFGKHYENLSMTVYNRWNEIVFSVKAKNASEMKYWDGKFKGENAPDGLYQYTITYTSEERQDQTQTIIGSVLIVR